MRFDIITLFPELFEPFLKIGITRRAYEAGLVDVRLWNPRDYAEGNYRRVDDRPFGGGPGMVMMAEPLAACLSAIRADRGQGRDVAPLVLFSPIGETLRHAAVQSWSDSQGAVLLCGRYEGVDHRVVEHLIDGEISIGDVVLSGGEVAACLVIEATTRLLAGAMGNDESPVSESFGVSRMLEEPHYTRPAEFRGWEVPEVLRSGDHAKIERWRRAQALHRTVTFRPDLIERRGGLSSVEKRLLEEFPCVPYPEGSL